MNTFVTGFLVSVGILLPLYLLIVLCSPQWSEAVGRGMIAHSQAARDFWALFRQSVDCYRKTYSSMKTELTDVTY